MSDTQTQILKECERQEENCLYTSTELLIWLRDLRSWKRYFILGQVVFSVGAASFALGGQALLAGGLGAIAGLSPIVWDSLKLDAHLEVVSHHASLFIELRDKFRRVRNIATTKGTEIVEQEFNAALAELAGARKFCVTPPERYFAQAKEKIERGDYTNSIDELA